MEMLNPLLREGLVPILIPYTLQIAHECARPGARLWTQFFLFGERVSRFRIVVCYPEHCSPARTLSSYAPPGRVRAKSLLQIGRMAVAFYTLVDNDSAEPKSTGSKPDGGGISFRTLRRERLARRRILEQIQSDGSSAPIVLDHEELVIRRDLRRAGPAGFPSLASPRHVSFCLRGPDCTMV